MVRLFLDLNASPDMKDSQGRTALHIAMRVGSERSLWALLSKGRADYTIVDGTGQPPLLAGLIRMWSRPDDPLVARNASLLAQCAGAAHLAEVQKSFKNELED